MNTEGDEECTCDVGPFANCYVCAAHPYKPSNSIQLAEKKGPHIVDLMLHYQKLAREERK